jgi:Tfp pilus assembly protein PilV
MVELLVTMLLLTIVMVGLAALQVAAIRNVTGGRRTSEAMRLAQATIENYKIGPMPVSAAAWQEVYDRSNSPLTNVGADGFSHGPYTVKAFIEDVGTSRLITVKVSWLDVSAATPTASGYDYEEFNVILSTLRYP